MREPGQGLVQAAGMLIIMIMVGAMSIDSGLYFALHRGMRNAADAAALASVAELHRNKSLSPSARLEASRIVASEYSEENMENKLDMNNDIEFGYVDPISGKYDPATFDSPDPDFPETAGYNAVKVTVRHGEGQANPEVPSIFNRFFGDEGYESAAEAVALYGGSIGSYTGLRPVYLCEHAWTKANQLYGDPTIPEITFYDTNLSVGNTNLTGSNACGDLPPGSFGLSDFTNSGGSPGSSNVRSWFDKGYNKKVALNEGYDPQPGTSLNSYVSELNKLRNDGTVITLPIYSKSSGVGTNAKFVVTGFVSFVITDFKTTGSNKYLRGHFTKTFCNKNCTFSDNPNGSVSVTKLRLVH